MSLTQDEFEKKLNQLLTGELSEGQLDALADYAAGDAGAARQLDRVKKLQAALGKTARDYRQTTYPGNLAAEVQERIAAQPFGTLRRRRWAFALAAALVAISSLVLFMRARPRTMRSAEFQPSVTVIADINRGLSEYKTANSRRLADWSRQATLAVPKPGTITITGLRIPDRPTMGGKTGIAPPNREGAKL